MAVHDWTRVDAGLFHDFHQRWAVALSGGLNAGRLPADYFALVEQYIPGSIPDVLTLRYSPGPDRTAEPATQYTREIAVTTQAPKTRMTVRAELDAYVRKASQVVVRYRHGDVVAVIEIVSPGHKASRAEFRALVEKSVSLIRHGIHLMVVDLFPPGKRDPQGVHKAIWDEFQENEFEVPADQPLTLSSYDAGPEHVAYIEFVGVGDALPDMPLFLKPASYVLARLQATYDHAWSQFPAVLRPLLEDHSASGNQPWRIER